MDDNIILRVIKESKTINEVLTKLGKNTSSVGYKYFKRYVTENNIDISHFFTQKEIIENQFKDGKLKKIDLDVMFKENSVTSRGAIKRRIIKDKLIEYKCNFCDNIGEWNGNKISLILDHINGVNNDNRMENLRFLCPNCNATLETHCRGAAGYTVKDKKVKEKNKKKYIPRINSRKIERPDIQQLLFQIKELGYVGTGKIYGVSDNTIRKWVKWYNASIV